ncbi:hypothetical protein GIY30_11460 [Gordonia sp. HNM0687]|uniref:Uncharacterized protein n=1 Tax=Gordonia mangrovi TaxID=2665643 RepID=A0A6L7GTG0_9ACTN|nr:hypothetical protein [Gordonia mangrovi]MXP21965.1 hypothetical protein [Gordonia mangrovi]UVF76324.1 hypothetical protein NWF22_13080 [Gordonia mangrovi]
MAGTVAALAVGVVMLAGCGHDEANGTPASAQESEKVMPTTAWELIDHIAANPPDTTTKAEQLTGQDSYAVTDYRFETESVDLSPELSQVKVMMGLNEDGWTFTAIDFTPNECITEDDVAHRYGQLGDGYVMPPGPNATYSRSLPPPSWGSLRVMFSADSKCLVGLSMEPTS